MTRSSDAVAEKLFLDTLNKLESMQYTVDVDKASGVYTLYHLHRRVGVYDLEFVATDDTPGKWVFIRVES